MASKEQCNSFIKKMTDFAMKYKNKFKSLGIYPSVFIAQGALESSWGTSKVTREAHNFHGLTVGGSWKGQVYHATTGYKFRKYNSDEEGLLDYFVFMSYSSHKKGQHTKHPYEQINAIADTWSNNSPSYTQQVIQVIKARDLLQFDTKVYPDKQFDVGYTPTIDYSQYDGSNISGEYDEGNLVDSKRMILPIEEDFYLSAIEEVSNPLHKKNIASKSNNAKTKMNVNRSRNLELSTISDNANNNNSDFNSIKYCTDNHINFSQLGYNSRDSYFLIKADPIIDSESSRLNKFDGDTVTFNIDSIKDGGTSFNANGIQYSSFNEYVKKNMKLSDYIKQSNEFSIRLLGIDAPEIPHYAPAGSVKHSEIKTFIYREIKNKINYIVENKNYKDDDKIQCIRFNDNPYWNQYYEDKNLVLIKDESDLGSITDGYKTQRIVQRLLNKAEDIYIMIDGVSLSNDGIAYANKYSASNKKLSAPFENMLDFLLNKNGYKFLGFNMFGQDPYKRYLGAIYVNINKKFLPKEYSNSIEEDYVTLNLAKYLILNADLNILPNFGDQPINYETNNFVSNAFNLPSYNFKNIVFQNLLDTIDDRDKVQEEIFDNDFHYLKEWTVLIGDTLFFVPPTSIRAITQNTAERTPLLRAKGSITKDSPKSDRLLELSLYFNDDHGINGYPYEETLPNGEKITYYMNGLRALVSQFKFTPFLPIENDYINNVLGIEAVTLSSLQITTMPNYPKCIAATLALEDFNYRLYMPELPVDTDIETFAETNYFAQTINFPTMRWYYQRALINGEKINNYDLDKYDEYPIELIKETLGNKTALAPMKHLDSKVLFYIPDEELLKKKLQVKNEAAKKAITNTYKFSNESKDFLNLMNNIYDKLNKVLPADANLYDKVSFHHDENKEKILNEINSVKGVTNVQLKDVIFSPPPGYEIIISYEQRMSKDELESLTKYMIDDPKYNFKSIIDKGEIVLRLRLDEKNADKRELILDSSQQDYQFLATCSQLVLENKEINDKQSSIDKLKDNIDLETCDSMRFVKYDMDDVNIANISCSYQNILTKTSLNGIDGYAPQYMGGQDTVIDIMFQTTNESVAAQLYALPRLVAEQIRKYRNVITSWPLRISSDITNLLGVYEVVVENVQIDTVPNQPGAYNIQMRLISVDRTLRNRDALIKLDNINNEGYQGNSVKVKKELKTYFDFQKSIGQAEIYPDLELPTLDELNKTGLIYIGNKNQPDQVYVDPDFYFLYSHTLFNDMIREGILEFFKQHNNISKKYNLSDSYGGEADIVFGKSEMVYDVESVNNAYEQEKESIIKTAEEGKEDLDVSEIGVDINETIEDADENSKQLQKETKKMNELSDVAVKESWNIADDIKCVFLENEHTKDINAKKDNVIKEEYNQYKKTADKIVKYIEANPVADDKGYMLSDKNKNKLLNGKYKVHPGVWISKGDIKDDVKEYISTIEKQCKIKLEDIGLNEKDLRLMVYAAACAATGKKEYEESDDKKNSNPRMFYDKKKNKPVGIAVGGTQDFNDARNPTSVTDAVRNGIVFGLYGTRMYTTTEIKQITGKKPTISGKYFLLDPYYTNLAHNNKEFVSYKYFCIINSIYATKAFIRICLYLYAKMIQNKTLPSFNARHQSEAIDNILSANLDELRGVSDKFNEQLTSIRNKMKSDDKAFNKGNAFIAILMGLTGKDKSLYSLINERDYVKLNQYKDALMNADDSLDNPDKVGLSTESLTKRFVLALIKAGMIKKIDNIHIDAPSVAQITEQYQQERLFIAAAEDPSKYILHSFVDMISQDKRGRMLRAFPTFYMCFIDEGYQTGMWKLTDNFYNYNAISEIQIAKSRKIAADTAKITMSNIFNTFTTDDEDSKENYEYNFKDVFRSYFSPYQDYEKRKQLQKEFTSVERAKLKTGTRVHIRMGYGANAAALPTTFNGCITEIATGPLVTVVAQSDGIELMNPLTSNKSAEDIKHDDEFFGFFKDLFVNKATPKQLLVSLLAYKGGLIDRAVRSVTDGRFKNDSPFGISHFGDPDNKDIFANGEVGQNIYEGSAASPWSEKSDISSLYSMTASPRLTFNLFGRTIWDILHICGSVSPDFLTGIVPFGLRSTIFHGAPRYYYAYDYIKKDGLLYEKRKPYQQFHLYTSYSDIIANGIVTSEQDMKTAAIGTYIKGGNKSNNQKTVGPLWADFMIYPEKQKTMIYDTSLLYKGTGVNLKLGFINKGISELMSWFADDEGAVQSGYKTAWRMTANALKNSIKDMYQGELIVLGDPSVKPNDRIFISDIYENMTGSCLAEAIVHNISPETGFTTTIVPDAIVTVDDRHELELQSIATKAMVQPLSGYLATVCITSMVAGAKKPFIKITGATLRKTGYSIIKKGWKSSSKIARSAGKSIGRFVGDTGKTVQAATTAGNAITIGATVAFAAEMAITLIISGLVAETIERKLLNYKVLQVFPLKKNGLPFTAGLNGSKGLVFGSPSYEDAGIMGELFDKIFVRHPDDPYISTFLKTLFVTDDMEKFAMSYQKKNNIISDDGLPAYDIAMLSIGDSLASKEVINQNTYNNINKYKNANIPPQDLANLAYVYDSAIIKQYKEKNIFTTIHETNSLWAHTFSKTYKLNGRDVAITSLKYDNEGRTVYDIPILNKKLLDIFEGVIKKIAAQDIADNTQVKASQLKIIMTAGFQMDSHRSNNGNSCVFNTNAKCDVKSVLEEFQKEKDFAFVFDVIDGNNFLLKI